MRPPDEGHVSALLERLAASVPAERVDEAWIFPPRRVAGSESTVVVLSTYEEGRDARAVLTARFVVQRDSRGRAAVQEALVEHGTAPADRIGRLVEGVLRRLDDEGATPPRHARIGGEPARWTELVAVLAAAAPGL